MSIVNLCLTIFTNAINFKSISEFVIIGRTSIVKKHLLPLNVEITISVARTSETDQSGKLMKDMLMEAGYEVTGYGIVADDFALIQQAIHEACEGCFPIN